MSGFAPPETRPDVTPAVDSDSPPTRTENVPLSRERVVAAATVLAERDGLEALSMRRLATELGVSTMAAYRHVPAKQTLVDDVVESAIARIPTAEIVGGEGTWQERLEELVIVSHRILTGFPGLLGDLRGGALSRPGVLNWLGSFSELVKDSGATREVRSGAATAIFWTLQGAGRLEQEWAPALAAASEAAATDEGFTVDTVSWHEEMTGWTSEELMRSAVRTIISGLERAAA